jgi:hypothetical protein
MDMHRLPTLTAEELGSLVEVAIEISAPKIPAIHLTRLIIFGYVVIGPDGSTQISEYA